MHTQKQKLLLIILDGYGEGKDYPYNAVTRSTTPFLDQLRKEYPTTLLKCHGTHVGLPEGSMGGSEVGHFTIGAGRIVFQSLEEINQSIKTGEFFQKPALKKAAEHCRTHNSKLHLLGMISDQGIHSHIDHLFALLDFAKKEGIERVYIHGITDGRDVPERSAETYITKILNYTATHGIGTLATLIGRYYAMDRDKNYARTKEAYDLYTLGTGTHETDPLEAIQHDYARGTETDYYLSPILLDENGLISPEDAVIAFNYRSDRMIQLTQAFTEPDFVEFPREKTVLPHYVCFGPYSKKAPVLYEANEVTHNLGQVLSAHGIRQLRIAETEKYAHVTFFFNSQIKEPYPGETQILIPSHKVASYDQKPEMSAPEITDTVIDHLREPNPAEFMLINYANGDLVGHSGNFEATVKGVEAVDQCLARLIPIALQEGYQIIVTADHGNADEMKYENGEDKPSHTLNPVIFILITPETHKLLSDPDNGLKDIAPTVLDLMHIEKPAEMTGSSLIVHS